MSLRLLLNGRKYIGLDVILTWRMEPEMGDTIDPKVYEVFENINHCQSDLVSVFDLPCVNNQKGELSP